MKRSLRVLLGAVLVASGCRGIIDIDDKTYVADGSGGGASSSASTSSSSSTSASSSGCGPLDTKQNCGACGHDCEGGECKDGVCQPYTLATLPFMTRGSGLAVPGDGYVYFGNQDQWSVRRVIDGVPKQEPKDAALVAEVTYSVVSLLVDVDKVFFTSAADAETTPVYVADKVGTGSAMLSGTYYLPFGLSSDDQHLYVTDASNGCRVVRVPKGGTPATDVVHDPVGSCSAVAVDDTHVYATDATQGRVVRVAKGAIGAGSSAPQVIADDVPEVSALAVDAAHVYFAGSLQLFRKLKDGGGKLGVLAVFPGAPEKRPQFLVPDGEYVYWAAPGFNGTGSIARVKNQTPAPAPEIIADGLYGARNLVVTPKALYWVEQFQQRITKMVR